MSSSWFYATWIKDTKRIMRLTILFDAPYWIGVLEFERGGYLCVGKHIFGEEPSDQVVYDFVQRDLLTLQARVTVGVALDEHHDLAVRRINPKRAQREVRREVAKVGISTRSHDAMRLQIEQHKRARSSTSREECQAEREHKREIARAKAHAKHRGH
jgi:hypothetical protein